MLPKDDVWETFLSGLNSFSDDIFEDGREQEVPVDRDVL